ncbi:unnamed protein product [Schistosoma guineensis]|nr:unnamed protein product [Schistosoma guineensis]
MSDKTVHLQLKYNGQPIIIDCLSREHNVSDLKEELFKLTRVLPKNQKILGLRTTNNDPVVDSTTLSCLVLKPGTKLMLIGSTQEEILKVNSTEDSPDVVDDFDFKEEDIQLCNVTENIEKVARRCKAYRPRKLSEFRDGKKLLVLDIDYTIFDHLTPAESVHQLARPHLIEFLTRAYVHYDIAIWSATSMTWILAKLGQLGIIPLHVAKTFQHRNNITGSTSSTNDDSLPSEDLNASDDQYNKSFRIALILDSSDMISVKFTEHGIKEVKPLAVIWNNHPQWGPHNTIMFDDVRRNFIMNPQSGLRIRSYRDAHVNCSRDHELLRLIKYLELIALNEQDFTQLNHNHWDRYVHKHRKQWEALKIKRKKQSKLCQDNETTNNQPFVVQSSTSSSSQSSIYASTINSNNVVSVPVISSSCTVHEPIEVSSSSLSSSPNNTTTNTTTTSSFTSGQKRVHDKNPDDNDDDNNHCVDTNQTYNMIKDNLNKGDED